MPVEHMNCPRSSELDSSFHQNYNRVSPPTLGSSRTGSSGCLNENQTKNTKHPQQIDAKLLFHIRKIAEKKSKNTESCNAQNSPTVTLDYIVNTLLKNHREYKRKYSDLNNFRQLVKIGFDSLSVGGTVILKRTENNKTSLVPIANNSNNKNNNLNKKRKWNEEDSEDIFEQEAIKIEILRNSEASSRGSMLNASIRQRYTEQNKKNARERESQSEIAANVPDITNENKIHAIVEESNATTVTSEPTSAVKKKKKKRSALGSSAKDGTTSNLNLSPVIPKERYADLGGMDNVLTQIRELIEYPLLHPELFRHLGVDPPRGVLLRGPPGVGKTHLANAVAGEIGVNFFNISAPEIIGGVSGESEARVRELFQTASISSPSLIFIDEIDAIAPKRGEGKSSGSANSMEKRIVAQLLTCMDSLATTKSSASSIATSSHVMVIGATNRPDAIDPALRRAGRFDREICLGVPDEKARESILKKMSSGMRLDGNFDYKLVAKKTPGFVGADLRSLTKEAAVIAINRIFKTVLLPPTQISSNGMKDVDVDYMDDLSYEKKINDCNEESSPPVENVTTKEISSNCRFQTLTEEQLAPLYVTMDDFVAAISSVQPSSKREGFATVPDVTWDNIGALNAIRDELTLSVLEPIHHPERFKKLGLPLPAGVMLYGPPGCGKTLLAKAISNESGANFISVKGPELLDKYVGESERAVRQVFERARSSSPCVVFFDELDSLCPKRGSDSGGGGGVSERVVNQLLTEMDGLESRSSVFVIAATNRPELIDPAMLRPGRLDKLLYVPLPTPDDRVSILKALGKKVALAEDVNLASIARNVRASGFSGADCAALLREAGLAVLRDCHGQKGNSASPLQITTAHFDYAFDHVKPSVSKKDQMKYDRMRDRMARARTRGCALDESRSSKEADSNEASNRDKTKKTEEIKG